MPDVKKVVEYYLKIPSKYIFLVEVGPGSIKLSEFSCNAIMFGKDEAEKLAERYGLEIKERTTITTIEVTEKAIVREEKK